MNKSFRETALAALWLGSGFIITTAHAAEYSRTATVTLVHPISQIRPAGPAIQNVMRVYVNVAPWGASNCRQDAVDFRGDDKLLIANFLTAWNSGKAITFYVDDTLQLVSGDTVCAVTALAIAP